MSCQRVMRWAKSLPILPPRQAAALSLLVILMAPVAPGAVVATSAAAASAAVVKKVAAKVAVKRAVAKVVVNRHHRRRCRCRLPDFYCLRPWPPQPRCAAVKVDPGVRLPTKPVVPRGTCTMLDASRPVFCAIRPRQHRVRLAN